MTTVISVATPKGGVGKTTTAVNLSAGLALSGYKVLIIDLDQSANASEHLGALNRPVTIDQVMRAKVSVKDAAAPTAVEGLQIIGSDAELAEYEIMLGAQVAGREVKLKLALQHAKRGYDFILIDCPPTLDLMTVNALTASDCVIAVADGELFSVRGAGRINELKDLIVTSTNPKLKLLGVLLNKFAKNINIHKEAKAALMEAFPKKVFSTSIRRNVKLAEAATQGLPVQLYAKGCPGARDFNKLTREVLKLCHRKRKR